MPKVPTSYAVSVGKAETESRKDMRVPGGAPTAHLEGNLAARVRALGLRVPLPVGPRGPELDEVARARAARAGGRARRDDLPRGVHRQ